MKLPRPVVLDPDFRKSATADVLAVFDRKCVKKSLKGMVKKAKHDEEEKDYSTSLKRWAYISAFTGDERYNKDHGRVAALMMQQKVEFERIRAEELEAAASAAEKRKVYASVIAQSFRDNGYNRTRTGVNGTNADELTIQYGDFDRGLVYEIANSGLLEKLESQGFRKVTFDNMSLLGGGVWSFSLDPK